MGQDSDSVDADGGQRGRADDTRSSFQGRGADRGEQGARFSREGLSQWSWTGGCLYTHHSTTGIRKVELMPQHVQPLKNCTKHPRLCSGDSAGGGCAE